MKILVLSLLRMGDVIMHRSLLRGIKSQFSNCSVHILINDSCKSIISLIEEADKIHLFKRDEYQKLINDPSSVLTEPYIDLNMQIENLNKEKFDIIYNFTHNKISAYLSAAISADKKYGVIAEINGFRKFENSWLAHFDKYFNSDVKSNFHYIEYLGNALDINPIWPLSNQNQKTISNLILINTLTSDYKKNWNLKNFKLLFNSLKKKYNNYEVKIICAPNELNTLLSDFNLDDILPVSFNDIDIYLRKACLLITVDTAIKHIAAENGIGIVEIATGSSDPSRTGALTSHSSVVRGQATCYPCQHSSQCPEVSYLCSDSLSVTSVIKAVEQVFSAPIKSIENNTKVVPGIGYLFIDKNISRTVLDKLISILDIEQNLVTSKSDALINFIATNRLNEDAVSLLNKKHKALIEFNKDISTEISNLSLDSISNFKIIFKRYEIIENEVLGLKQDLMWLLKNINQNHSYRLFKDQAVELLISRIENLKLIFKTSELLLKERIYGSTNKSTYT